MSTTAATNDVDDEEKRKKKFHCFPDRKKKHNFKNYHDSSHL